MLVLIAQVLPEQPFGIAKLLPQLRFLQHCQTETLWLQEGTPSIVMMAAATLRTCKRQLNGWEASTYPKPYSPHSAVAGFCFVLLKLFVKQAFQSSCLVWRFGGL